MQSFQKLLRSNTLKLGLPVLKKVFRSGDMSVNAINLLPFWRFMVKT